MKRTVAIILILLALLSCMAVSASASGAYLDPVPYTFDSDYRLSYTNIRLKAWGTYAGSENFDMTKNYGDTKPTYTYISGGQSARDFNLMLSSPDWRGYDFLDIQLSLDVASISSISANLGSVVIPFEQSYVSSAAFDDQSHYLTLRLDLRGLDVSSQINPEISVRGLLYWEHRSLVALTACSGVTIRNNPILSFFDSILGALSDMHTNIAHWFDLQITSFGTWFKDLEASFDASIQKVVDAIKGDSSAGESFGQQVDQKSEELQSMGEAFESVQRPDVGSVQMNVNAYLSPEDLHLATSGLSAAISSGPILNVFMMALIMATVGYILYGKK